MKNGISVDLLLIPFFFIKIRNWLQRALFVDN